MDFHSLSRKELQSLCKKNNIPANVTNVAMAQALAALHQVKGLDELVNRPVEHDAQGFQEDKVIATPDTHCRTSTRRKAARGGEGIEQENKDMNMAATPAVPTSRRRATAISTRRKTKPQVPDDEKNGGQGKPTEVPKTPAAVSTVTRAYNTRRSVRLLEKNLSKMSLMDAEDIGGLVKMDTMSEDMSYISQQTDDLPETGKRPSMQIVSTEVSEKIDDLEVTSQEKNTEDELGYGVHENAVGASLQSDPREGLGKIRSWDVELHDSNLKMEESSETFNYSNEVCDGSDFDINKKTGEAVHADNQAETGMFDELEDSCDFTELENEKCVETKQGEPFELPEDASREFAAFSLSLEMPDNASTEVTGQDILGLLPMSSVNKTDNHDGNDSAEISALSNEVSGDASREVTDQDFAASTVEMADDTPMEATDQDIVGSFPMSSVSDDSVSLKGSKACNIDNQDGNYSAEISEDVSMEELVASNTDTNTLADNDVFTEESAIPEQEFSISGVALKHKKSPITKTSVVNIDEVMKSAPIYEQKTSNIQIPSLADNDVIPEETAIPEQEFNISGETLKSPITEVPVVNIDEVMTIAPVYERKTSDIQIHSIVAGQSKGEPKYVGDEPIQEDDKIQTCMVKENTSYCEYHKMSVRGLKKMLRNLNLDDKSNSKSNLMKEVDRKRTALEALPENQMTAGETQNDG
ncbi:hypothetical protein VNO77_41516 [Canavalia gladiata]|uniref:Uncharacterized protein n=1 Tax=Canavalia gladiata TaxID=3824 RepID=A0AAN9K186_CANGL